MSKTIAGTFEPHQKGGGFLRSAESNYSVSRDDVFVPRVARRLDDGLGGQRAALVPAHSVGQDQQALRAVPGGQHDDAILLFVAPADMVGFYRFPKHRGRRTRRRSSRNTTTI